MLNTMTLSLWRFVFLFSAVFLALSSATAGDSSSGIFGCTFDPDQGFIVNHVYGDDDFRETISPGDSCTQLLSGDPDRPVIVGSLSNGDDPSGTEVLFSLVSDWKSAGNAAIIACYPAADGQLTVSMIDAIFFDSDSDPAGTPCLDLILAGQIPDTPISGLLTVRSNNPQSGNDNSAGTAVMDNDHIYLRYFLDTNSSSVIQRCTFDAGAQTFVTEMVDGIDQEGFSEHTGEHCLITRKALLQEGYQNHSIYATGADPDATVLYSFGGQRAILPRNLLIDLAATYLTGNQSAMIPKDFLTELPTASLVGGQTVIIPRNFLIDLPASAGGQTVIIPRNFLIDLPASAGGQTVIIPRNFLIDLPANRITPSSI